jgi:hypothetical protein
VLTPLGSTARWARHVQVSASATDALSGVASVTWVPGDGALSERLNSRLPAIHNYRFGTFAGSVTAVDRAGNQATQPFTITVVPCRTSRRRPSPIRFDPNVLAGRALRLVLGASEQANVTITASVRALGQTYRLPVARRALLTGRYTPVRLLLRKDVRRAVARALRRHRPVRAQASVVAVDRSGNRAATAGSAPLTGVVA